MFIWLFTCKLKDKEEIRRSFVVMGQIFLASIALFTATATLLIWLVTVGNYLGGDPWAGDFTLWIIWVPVIIAVFLILKITFCKGN